jgi:NAD-dependent dihydropyrimidine dehydrogenase PreA subunit
MRRLKEVSASNRKKALLSGLIFILTFSLLEFLSAKAPARLVLLDRFFPGMGTVETFFLSLYAVWIGRKMLDPASAPRFRGYIWAFFSVVFFSQLILGLAGFEKMLMTGKLHLPVPVLIISGPLFRGGSFFMPILFLFTLLLAGPAWCSYLCYIGAWDDRLCRLKKGKILENPPRAGRVRAVLLLLAVALPLILNILRVPVLIAASLGAAFGIGGVLVMAFISSRRGTMVHCTVYCPVGLAANILGKVSPWRIAISDNCTGCGICTEACRYNALTREDLDKKKPGLSCTLCGDCIPQCGDSHISYSFPGLSAERARVLFIVIIVVLHTLFLGVARI